ncbi:MAG: GtrA family protein [Bacteroidales bacterium]|nr:GtrA family protein [Bacteroidales bacterium]
MGKIRQLLTENSFSTLFIKYKQIIYYIFFGVVSTIVNILTFWICNSLLNINYLIANVISWITAVFCAYITNKLWVFESRGKSREENIYEAIQFYIFRLISLGMDMACMYIMIDILQIKEIIAKIVANVVVVVANYIFSKLIIFKKRQEKNEN